MYVRKKYVRRGEKTYGPYWVVVRSTRENGKPRQRVVANIGPADDYDEADRIARMKAILCCVPGCGEAASAELGEGARNQPVHRVKLRQGGLARFPFIACLHHSKVFERGGEIEAALPAVLHEPQARRGWPSNATLSGSLLDE